MLGPSEDRMCWNHQKKKHARTIRRQNVKGPAENRMCWKHQKTEYERTIRRQYVLGPSEDRMCVIGLSEDRKTRELCFDGAQL